MLSAETAETHEAFEAFLALAEVWREVLAGAQDWSALTTLQSRSPLLFGLCDDGVAGALSLKPSSFRVRQD